MAGSNETYGGPLARPEMPEGPGKPVVECGCSLNLRTGERIYCAAHKDLPGPRTPREFALAVLERAQMLVKKGRRGGELDALDYVALEGYLTFAVEQIVKIEELKRARPKGKDTGAVSDSVASSELPGDKGE